MKFEIVFYETVNGHAPVREFLLELKARDPDDFAAVASGLEKLRNRQYHREPLTKALGDGLFELHHVGKLNTRVLWFFERPSHHCRSWHPQQRPGDCGPRPRHGGETDVRLAGKK